MDKKITEILMISMKAQRIKTKGNIACKSEPSVTVWEAKVCLKSDGKSGRNGDMEVPNLDSVG